MTSPSTLGGRTEPLSYAVQIDGLRAIAVLCVCFHHWTAIGHAMQLGLFGVQLFFVISGYLITGILLDLRRAIESGAQSIGYSARQFYIRRFLRIFPLYYFCLLTLYAIGKFGIRETFPWHFFYLSNLYFFLEGKFGGNLSHFWSLAVEEQFYLIWPWLILCAPTSTRMIPRVIGAIILLGPLSRWTLWVAGYDSFAEWNSLLFANLDTLGIGALLAWLRVSAGDGPAFRQRLQWAASAAAGVALLLQFVPDSAWFAVLHRVALAILCAFLVLRCVEGLTGPAGQALTWRPLVYVGKVSYGVYVFHMFAPDIVGKLLTFAGLPHSGYRTPGGIALMFLVTFCLAAISWRFFEAPLNRLKSHFPYTVRKANRLGGAELHPSRGERV